MAPMGDSIVLADDGHAANIEQPKAFNEALQHQRTHQPCMN